MKLSKYCTVQEVGKEVLILFETAKRLYDEYWERREIYGYKPSYMAMKNTTLSEDPDHPLNNERASSSWEAIDAEYVKGRHELMRTFGRFKSLMKQRLEPDYR